MKSAVNTLRYHWTYYTGTTSADAITQWSFSGNPVVICIIGTPWKTTRPIGTLRCQWNHTGWCQHLVVSQWQPSVNLQNWNTLEDYWKTAGRPLGAHWKDTGYQLFSSRWHVSVHWGLIFRHWIATGLPLNYHRLSGRKWLRFERQIRFKQSNSIRNSNIFIEANFS